MSISIPFPQLWFEAEKPKETGVPQLQLGKVDRKRKILRCAACGHGVTSQKARIEVKGGHEHRFFNPHGVIFNIGCFSEADGCRTTSQSSDDFTWFPGYRWRIASCAQCDTHLGWLFSSEEAAFYGLIVNRLMSDEEEGEDGA